MWCRLEKINPAKREYRFYTLSISQSLFGEWCLIREWGRIGTKGGRRRMDYFSSEKDAATAMVQIRTVKTRRGYITCPVQLNMFKTD